MDPALAFGRACADGTGRFLAQDHKGALESFQGAVHLAPKNPLGHYLAAEAYLALGDIAEADASLRRADASTDYRTTHLRSKILFLVAVTKERAQKLDEARSAWQAYNDFVMNRVDGGGTFPHELERPHQGHRRGHPLREGDGPHSHPHRRERLRLPLQRDPEVGARRRRSASQRASSFGARKATMVTPTRMSTAAPRVRASGTMPSWAQARSAAMIGWQ